MQIPNGVAVLHVLARHVRPRSESSSKIQDDNWDRCKSLKRSGSQGPGHMAGGAFTRGPGGSLLLRFFGGSNSALSSLPSV